MAYNYTCSACDQEFSHDNRSYLIDMVQEHAEDEHDMDMSRSDIHEDIEED